MKASHRADLCCWSVFDTARDLDFHGWAWFRDGGAVLIDPVAMGAHDRAQAAARGGVSWIVVTNSDHVRETVALSAAFNASIAGPAGERAAFPIPCDRWLADGDTLVPGLTVATLDGSKTPGELALRIGDTLIFGDLVRGHRGGALNLLPDAKLTDRAAAEASVRRLIEPSVQAVLVGDGWPVFRDGAARLAEALQAPRP
ncbi:MAG: MBL fold metallo-hydrolase [Alphaproteobacteria bacterium]|nr:MBL fold metallo-hydrolase [Alphaproteobacteria bacterium]